MNPFFKKSVLASFISIAVYPALSFAEKLPSVTAGTTQTATENTVYDQQVGPSGIIYVNGGTLNIENNVTVDTSNSTVSPNGYGILILGNGSVINGTDNLNVNVNQAQDGIGFNPNSSNAIISLGNNAHISSGSGVALRVTGTGNTVIAGDNLALESSSYVPLHVAGQNTNIVIGKNATFNSVSNSAIVMGGQNNQLSVDDGAQLIASDYGFNLSGTNNVANFGQVEMSGSRAVLMSGQNNQLTIASGSQLTGTSNESDPDGSVLALGGINNTITVDNSTLTGNGTQIIRFSASGQNARNDGNTVNLNNATVVNNYSDPAFQNNDSVIGILTTNNNQRESDYGFTLNFNGGSIETTNSNLINSDMQQHQNSNEVSSAKSLINMNDVAMDNDNGYYLVSFGSSELSQNSTDLTFNLTRTDASSFSKGIINNDQSTLLLNLDASRIQGDIVNNTGSQGAMQITASNGSSVNGNIYALNDAGEVDNNNAYTSVALENASWFTTDDSHVVNLINGGTLVFNSPDAGHIVTVHGDYTGNNGNIIFNGQLAGDDSVIDKLVVEGDTSGNTSVRVNNIGGLGAQTINGIELISVAGNSDGQFTQNGRIVAGAYDYSLVQNGNNWYLTNGSGPTDPTDPVDPDNPGSPDERPEAGSYIDNLAAANNLFNVRLHDRLGETQYTDMLTGEQKVTSMWLRNVGGHNRWHSQGGQLNTQSNRYVMQLGGDIAQWSSDGLDRVHLGVMAGYGHQHSNTTSDRTDYKSKGSVNGYSTGLYGTWYQNDADKNGLYVDSWVQYSWFNNSVKGEDLAKESYKSKGFTASLESGYTHKLGEFSGSLGTTSEWFVQPKAQATWMGVKANDHTEANGTRVSGKGNDNVQTRLGVKTFLKSHNKMDDGKDREFQPFVEANWIHNTHSYGVMMDDALVTQAGTRNIGELKTGVEGQLSKSVNLWGNVAQQMGDRGYSDTRAMVGMKYSF